MNIYFTDFFDLQEDVLDSYGAFNISLINDLPLFIDPFLIFGSDKKEYQKLHQQILKYLTFLKKKSTHCIEIESKIKSLFTFSEVKQNWLGYSKVGNGGSGLGSKFGRQFSSSLNIVFDDLNCEEITQSSHLEKVGLFEVGIGRDNISDLTTNLIKEFLLNYTEVFALKNIESKYLKKINVEKVYFDYKLERWMPKEFTLPFIFHDYVLLSPKDLLTKDSNWINRKDLDGNFDTICRSISNGQLRYEISNYFTEQLPKPVNQKKSTKKEISWAAHLTINKYPIIINYYVKWKEDNVIDAKNVAQENVKEVHDFFVKNIQFSSTTLNKIGFYDIPPTTSYNESMKRVLFLKEAIENMDLYRLFYLNDKPIKRESHLQLIYRLTWFASSYDVNREPNNGRGPADYTASKGSKDKTVVEFKLASNSKLKQNLAKQVDIYEKANNTKKSIKVILYFDDKEYKKVVTILKELKLDNKENIILIDAGKKISASNVRI